MGQNENMIPVGLELPFVRKKSVFWSKIKDILDEKLWAILEALDIATNNIRNMKNALVTIFCDSQKALRVIEQLSLHKRNWLQEVPFTKKPKSRKVINIT